MVHQPITPSQKAVAGDAAVDGLLAGVVAGLFKGSFLVLAGIIAGSGWQDVLVRLDPQGSSSLRGLMAHLAVAGIYGVLFGLLASRSPWAGPGWLAGLAYSAFVLLFSWFVLLPVAAPGLRELGILSWAASHALYGLILGMLVARTDNAGRRLSRR